MADNDNRNQDQNQDPFGHPIKKNNWWLYILGGLCFAGLIAWFFIDWSYKDRKTAPDQIDPYQVEQQEPAPMPAVDTTDTLPTVTVDAPAPAEE